MAKLRSWTGLLAIVGGLVPFATHAAAQQPLSGQVVDAQEQPVAGLEVVLHRVTEGGGTIVATDTTDAGGIFSLRADGVPNAVFFAAARYEGQLSIGAMLRVPFPASGYILRVGGDPAAAAVPLAAPAGSSRRAVTLAIMATLLLLAAFAFTRALRPPAQRRLLLRLAELEEARAATGGMSADAELERSRILARLRYGPSA